MKNFFLLALFFCLSTNGLFASGFNIQSIGGVATGGQMVSKFWHTSLQPTLRGEATPGANVTITIDGTALMTAADSSGDWVFTPNALAAGDHQVSLESGGTTMKFTLTLGSENVDWNKAGAGPAETLPTAGTTSPTIAFIVGGMAMLIAGGKMLSVNKK